MWANKWDKGIKGMLIGWPNVIGVTFQRPVAPPPFVQLCENRANGQWEQIEFDTGNKHSDEKVCAFPLNPGGICLFMTKQAGMYLPATETVLENSIEMWQQKNRWKWGRHIKTVSNWFFQATNFSINKHVYVPRFRWINIYVCAFKSINSK